MDNQCNHVADYCDNQQMRQDEGEPVNCRRCGYATLNIDIRGRCKECSKGIEYPCPCCGGSANEDGCKADCQ